MKKILSLFVISVLAVSTLEVNAYCKPLEPDCNDDEVIISFAGDCALGGYKGGSSSFDDTYNSEIDVEYFLKNVQPVFEFDDITFVNLEGPLTRHPQEKVKEFSVRCEPQHVSILQYGSVEGVNLANNHIYDCGTIGFEDTKETLKQAGIFYAGEGETAIYDVRGIKVGFLGYNVWAEGQRDKDMKRDIEQFKNKGVNIICVEFHGGVERKFYPESYTVNAAHNAVDYGASVVVCSHAHVIQGIEQYNGKPICYGLGNFCYGLSSNPKDKDTFIFQTVIAKDGTCSAVDIIPCTISSVDSKNDYRPTIQDGTERGDKIYNRLKEYSSVFEHSFF